MTEPFNGKCPVCGRSLTPSKDSLSAFCESGDFQIDLTDWLVIWSRYDEAVRVAGKDALEALLTANLKKGV
jgi:endogenous inhibitor of DNA gyrase (YacG/DUF329 family)